MFVLKDPLVCVFAHLARRRSLVDGDHRDYVQFGNHENNSGHYSDKFFFLGKSCGNEMNAIRFLVLFLFLFLNKSDCCGREGGAEKYIFYFLLFSKVHLI